jgi:hypothetical protein
LFKKFINLYIYINIIYINIQFHAITPHSFMITDFFGLPYEVPQYSIKFNVAIPSLTSPNTVCFPSNHGVGMVVIKNYDPFVLGPALAIESNPGLVCFTVKFSSGNVRP